eukprot:m.173184 g.173184  ORF g.173184 m.173184 type:complete len:365 (+) comp39094_c0_seq9:651-1745(+)
MQLSDLSRIELIDESNNCLASRRFRLSRERWWYFAVSNCFSKKGVKLDYKLHMLNPGGFWKAEYSADEQGILETDMSFLLFFVCLILWTCKRGVQLHQRGMLHVTFKLFAIALAIHTFSLLMLCIHYGLYGGDGVGSKPLKMLGRFSASISEVIFLLMVILFAKGWTVVRARLTNKSQLVLAILVTLYTVVYVSMFIWEAKAFDPGRVLYVYDSPAGYGLVALSFFAFCWFVSSVITTVKKFPEKARFYAAFSVVYSIWFLARPVIVLVSNFHVVDWVREKVVNAVNLNVALLAYVAFLIFTIPSLKCFPFHLKTSQVDIDLDDCEDPEHPYALSTDYIGSTVSRNADISIFQGRSDERRETPK